MGVKVGAILNTAPEAFRERIMAIDSIKLDAGDTEYFDVGMGKITKRLDKLSAEKQSGGGEGGGGRESGGRDKAAP